MTTNPEPCLPVLSIIARGLEPLENVLGELEQIWSTVRLTAPRFHFNESDYYADEMGQPLFRWWGYRNELANPANLAEWKKSLENLEQKLSDEKGNRTVNLDPGYLNYGLLVLASHKHHHQKIYLGQGVYADPVLEYVNGSYRPFHWSFPDFQDDRYYTVLENFRQDYKSLRN